MGREVRRVPADWVHPKDSRGNYIPLHGGSFSARLAEWDEGAAKWAEGLRSDWNGGWVPHGRDGMSFAEWNGRRPVAEDYMPDWPTEQRTQLMMYENTSEGTPISSTFATPEELARWLSDTGASSFGGMTASYEQWLNVCRGEYAPSMTLSASTGLISGVEATTEIFKQK